MMSCQRGPEWNVVLLTLDTTRADHLRCYGYNMIETPALNSLAYEGVLFERAYSPIPLTMPSHTSIMTGTLPPFHGVRDNGSDRLPDSMVTLAEVLKDNGYQTAGFVSASVLFKVYNLVQGFDHWDEEGIGPQTEEVSAMVPDRKAEVTTNAALEWLDQAYKEKFFVWVHYYDPHAIYDPPSPYDKYYFLSPYDGEIAYMDSQIKRLLERLEKLEIMQNTLVVAVGDHGESLGEHGEQSHAIMIYNPTQHIPFIVRVPGLETPGLRFKTPVYLTDVMPTILDLLSIKVPQSVYGRSLRPFIENEPYKMSFQYGYIESEYSFYHYGWSGLKALMGPQYKYIRAPRPELYNFIDDPDELNNLYDQLPEVAADLEYRLKALEQEIEQDQNRPEVEQAELSEEDKKMLESLGYMGAGDRDLIKVDRSRDPKDYIHLSPLMSQLQAYVGAKDFSKMLDLALKILEEDPNNLQALRIKANALYALGMHAQAVEAYNYKIEQAGDDSMSSLNLGNIYFHLYKQALSESSSEKAAEYLEKANQNFARSTEINPHEYTAWYYLGIIAIQREDYGAVRRIFDEKLNDKRMGHLLMAHYWEDFGNVQGAQTEYEEAIKDMEEPNIPPIFIDYAYFLFTQGHNLRALELLEKVYDFYPSQRGDQLFMELMNITRSKIESEKGAPR